MREQSNRVVGRRLRKIRRLIHVSSEEMAETLDLSVGHFRKLERGDHALSLACMQTLNEQYGIDLNYLITGKSREEDIARDLACGTPEQVIYSLHQLLNSFEHVYLRNRQEKEER